MPPSNGCAEFTLKNPPPFVPSCLIAIWLATGPPGIACVWPATVFTSVKPWVFWITPQATSTMANDERDREQDAQRGAHEVDPEVADRALARRVTRPRISATMTAMPAAADTKFWTVSPIIWVRWLIVFSPP